MSQVIDGIRAKFDQYKDIPDDELALRIGSKYPVYLDKDTEFKKEFEGAAAGAAIKSAQAGTSALLNVLTNPAAGEAAQAGAEDESFETMVSRAAETPRSGLERAARDYALAPGNITGQRQTGGMTEPFVPIPKMDAKNRVLRDTLTDEFGRPPTENEAAAAAAIVNQAKGYVEFVESPLGLLTAGTGFLGKAAQKLIALGFAGSMAKDVPKAAREAGKASVIGTPQEKYEAYLGLGQSVILPGVLAHAGFKRNGPDILKYAAKSAEPVAPMTAAAVQKQAAEEILPKTVEDEPEVKSAVLTPSEAQTPQGAPKATESATESQGVVNDRITAASYTNPKTGETTTGENHIEAAKAQGVEAPKIPTQRHGDEYGFEVVNQDTGEKRYVSRDEAELIARANGQLLRDPERGKLHSDEVEFYKPKPKEENAIQSESSQLLQPVRDEPGKGAGEVPAQIGSAKDDEGGGEASPQKVALPEYPAKKAEAKAARESEQQRPEPEAPKTEQKFRIKNTGPQTYSIVERMEATPVEIENGEQPVRVKNDRTGEESVVLENQLQAVKERTAEERAASKGMSKKELDDELLRLGLEPISFTNMAEKREAIRRAKLKGPGSPSVYQGPDPESQISQLEKSFRNVEGKKVSIAERIKEAWNLGEKMAAGKDAVSRAIAGLKATGDYLVKQWEGYATLDDLLRAKGDLSAIIEQRSHELRKFAKTVLKNVPSKAERAAIAKWVDAGGDQNELHWGFMQTQPEYQQAYADAMHLSGDTLVAAQNIRNFFESRLQEAIDAGVLEDGVADYIHRVYEKDPQAAQQLTGYVQSGILSRNPALAKRRVFQMDWEAERLGYRPVQDFLTRLATYEKSLTKAIAARNFVKKVVGYKDEAGNRVRGLLAEDGRPIIDVAGMGTPVEDAEGVREATLINPSFKPGDDKNPLNNRIDYKERPDYSALRKWKWASTDAAGKPIYVQGNVVIHPKYAERIDALLKPSSMRFTENQIKKGAFKAAIGISSTVKQTMLDMSGFHQVQIAIHAAEHKVLPWRIIQDIDFTNEEVQGLMKGGTTLGGEYRESHMGEGLVGRSVTRLIPGLSEAMETYHNWLFQDFIPRVKMSMALKALERNKARFAKEVASGKMKMDEVYHLTANQANAAFGELNYTMLERSKTAQDISRIIFLAPDFLEARGRFALQALTKHGNEQRMALAIGALTMYTLARIGNQLLNGQPHMEPENAFSLVIGNKAYSLRTVQGDILHALPVVGKPVQFWMSRLNPVYGRTLLELATGRDYFGRKRSAMEQVWDAVSTAYPVSLRFGRERTLIESLFNGMGVTARRYSDTDEAFKLAQKWKDKNGVGGKGEFIYDSNKDPLRPLKLALSNSDDAAAVKEIKKLVDSKQMTISKLNDYFNRYSNMPFTGSHDNDKKFEKSLSEDDKKTVHAAREHKKEIRSLYQKAREKYTSALHSSPQEDIVAPQEAEPEPVTP